MYILCDQRNFDGNMHIMGILCTYYVISSMIFCSPSYCSLFYVGGRGAGVSGWGGLLLVLSATSRGKGTTVPASLANSCE